MPRRQCSREFPCATQARDQCKHRRIARYAKTCKRELGGFHLHNQRNSAYGVPPGGNLESKIARFAPEFGLYPCALEYPFFTPEGLAAPPAPAKKCTENVSTCLIVVLHVFGESPPRCVGDELEANQYLMRCTTMRDDNGKTRANSCHKSHDSMGLPVSPFARGICAASPVI